QLGRLADQDGQHAGGVRIERPAVTDLRRTQKPSEMGDDLKRRHAGALLDREDAGGGPGHRGWDPRTSRTAASTVAVAAGSEARTVQPAAFWGPPPPNRPAMRLTGTSPLPRRLTFTTPGPSSRKSIATRTPSSDRG